MHNVTGEGSAQVCVLEEWEREVFGLKTKAICHKRYGPIFFFFLGYDD